MQVNESLWGVTGSFLPHSAGQLQGTVKDQSQHSCTMNWSSSTHDFLVDGVCGKQFSSLRNQTIMELGGTLQHQSLDNVVSFLLKAKFIQTTSVVLTVNKIFLPSATTKIRTFVVSSGEVNPAYILTTSHRSNQEVILIPKGRVFFFFFFNEWEHRTGTMCPFSSLHPSRNEKKRQWKG